MAGEDFINVQLTEAGAKFAGEGKQIAVHNSRRSFLFTVGKPTRVLKAYEWSQILLPMQADGEAMFEIVQDQPPVPAQIDSSEEK